jgi:hypothetical protein
LEVQRGLSELCCVRRAIKPSNECVVTASIVSIRRGVSCGPLGRLLQLFTQYLDAAHAGRGQPTRDFAEKAKRRAQFAWGYLVILCVVLILIFIAMM